MTVIGAAAFLFAVDGPIQVLGPIVAEDVYDGARTWGLTSAAMGIGQIAGGLLGLRWRPRRPILVICGGMWLAALPVAFLALEAPVWALYVAMVVDRRRVGSLRPVLDDVHAARGAAGHDLARVRLRLVLRAGVLSRRGWRWPDRWPTPRPIRRPVGRGGGRRAS